MNTVERRHVLVVAVQCRKMRELTQLRNAAHRLHNSLVDQG